MPVRDAHGGAEAFFQIPGWLSSEAFTTAMGSSPCGCEIEEKADGGTASDRHYAALNAAELRAAWGCPGRYSDAIPATNEHLDVNELAALSAVQALTGFGDHCTTCPRKYASLPHIRRARLAYTFAEKGCPEYVEPEPTAAMVEAIECIGAGVNACQIHAIEKSMADSKAASEEARSRISRR